MRELRQDVVTGNWVVVHTDAPLGPGDFRIDRHEKLERNCPFCAGNERMTPPEVAAFGRMRAGKGKVRWRVRVVPNRFPAVVPEERSGRSRDGLFERMGAFGRHEVIVDHFDHNAEMADFPASHMRVLVRAYRARLAELARDPRLAYALIFKNRGPLAGASLDHPHTQLTALGAVPGRAADMVRGSARYAARRGSCVFCDMVRAAPAAGLEVLRTRRFAVLAPFASRLPFEAVIVPLRHRPDFWRAGDRELDDFARTLTEVLERLRRRLDDPPFNFMIHTAPFRGKHPSYHWHLELVPKLIRSSAFEWGTGFHVNPTPPELAASILRK